MQIFDKKSNESYLSEDSAVQEGKATPKLNSEMIGINTIQPKKNDPITNNFIEERVDFVSHNDSIVTNNEKERLLKTDLSQEIILKPKIMEEIFSHPSLSEKDFQHINDLKKQSFEINQRKKRRKKKLPLKQPRERSAEVRETDKPLEKKDITFSELSAEKKLISPQGRIGARHDSQQIVETPHYGGVASGKNNKKQRNENEEKFEQSHGDTIQNQTEVGHGSAFPEQLNESRKVNITMGSADMTDIMLKNEKILASEPGSVEKKKFRSPSDSKSPNRMTSPVQDSEGSIGFNSQKSAQRKLKKMLKKQATHIFGSKNESTGDQPLSKKKDQRRSRQTWLTREKETKKIAQELDPTMMECQLSPQNIMLTSHKMISKSRNVAFHNHKHAESFKVKSNDQVLQSPRNFQSSLEKIVKKKYRNPNFIDIDNEAEMEDGAAVRFKHFKNNFINMTRRSYIFTQFDIVSVIITYDSQLAITVLKESNTKYYIRLYGLESYEQFMEYKIVGQRIKAKDIQQNPTGMIYALAYLDDGVFKILIFDRQGKICDINVCERLKIDNSTIPISGIPDPIITCCFIDNSRIFANLFHRITSTNWHFIYNFITDEIEGEAIPTKMNCSQLNFPIQSIYQYEKDQVYSFYRQGESYCIDMKSQDKKIKNFQKILGPGQSLDQLYLIYNKILIVDSSDSVLFFKEEEIVDYDNQKHLEWRQYHQLDEGGFIYFIKGNKQIQITTPKLIYFFRINEKTLMPELENCMYNFMDCTVMMFGSLSRYCITYKAGQIGFNIYRRKYYHRFQAELDTQSFEGSMGCSVNSMKQYFISHGNFITVYNQFNFLPIQEIEVPYPPYIKNSQDGFKKKMEILNIQMNKQESQFAVLVGYKLFQKEVECYFFCIFHRHDQCDWKLAKKIDMPDELRNVCHQFEFKNRNQRTIIFTDAFNIIEFNYDTLKIDIIYEFKNCLNSQPIFTVFNLQQKNMMVATFYDVLFVDLVNHQEFDIDDQFHIGDIRSIVYIKKSYYLLANKFQKLLGYYLIQIKENDPCNNQPTYLINWKSRLDISDANLYLLDNPNTSTQELVVCYKSIYINTYNILLISLDTKMVLFRYETQHLWEASINSILLDNQDLIIFSQTGKSVISLGKHYQKLVGDPRKGFYTMLHSLESCNDLKLEQSNHLLFSQQQNQLIVSVQEQYQDGDGETYFEDIYKFCIDEMSLRELLLCQSIFSCRQQFGIVKLIEIQPQIKTFLKSFLELDKNNLVQILSFDSKSIAALLHEKHQGLFQKEFPIIYKLSTAKIECDVVYAHDCGKKSAIDTALQNNQVRAITIMLEYIIKYQNSYVHSYLFKDNFLQLMEIGIEVAGLLNSNVFVYTFDYQEWASIHHNNTECIRPYNSTLFQLRYSYREIFGDMDQNLEDQMKYYKIKYSLNILPSISPNNSEGTTLMDVCGSTDELDVFDSKALSDLLEFKWKSASGPIHMVGGASHLLYLLVFSVFVNELYVYNHYMEYRQTLFMVQVSCLIYPFVYDMTQLKKQGAREYFQDYWNYADQLHIWGGFMNVFLHAIEWENEEILQIRKTVLIILSFLMLIKTFFFMRLFKSMAHLVMMMLQVLIDLRAFMFFYFILIWISGLILNILGMVKETDGIKDLKSRGLSYPGIEYKHLPIFLRQFFNTLRISLGDFNFAESIELEPFENVVFWVTWVTIVVMTCIVFLNFIIAEVSSSYESVKTRVKGLIDKERAQLIREAEDMMLVRWKKNKNLFPKYLISREIED